MSGLPKPYFQLIYKGIDISSELAPMLISCGYTDHQHGEADEIDFEVHDKDGRWKGSWKPEPGDLVQLTIFDGVGGVLPCGEFELDEPEASGSRDGDVMTVRGLAAPITKKLRTENTKAFESQNLTAIVNQVAGQNGLSVEGQIDNLFFERVTQRRERDLEFLTRLAEETGHYFTVKGKRAIFTNFQSVDGRGPALTIFHGDRQLISYSLKQQTADTYSKAKASYLDQKKKETTRHEETDSTIKTGDELKIAGERMESKAHAEARAKSALHFKNRKVNSGTVDLVGNVNVIAGNTFELVGFGQYSGKRLFEKATHTMTRDGYTCSGDFVDARA